MPDFQNMPRQRGLSDNPQYVSNPRKFARSRCERAMSTCDRLIMYMGEIIQTYSPPNLTPTDAFKEGLELASFATSHNIDLNALIDMSQLDINDQTPLGKFGGYIAVAAVIMQAAKDTRDSIAELRSTI